MDITRRAFVGGAAAFALIQEAFATRAANVHAYSTPAAKSALMCRRLYLDICGRLPRRAEVEAYIADRSTRKQEALVDKLLASTDYADYWSLRYCDFLRVKSEFPINLWPNAVYVYHRRVRNSILRDEPWNDFARALLYGRGSNFRVPESNFLRAIDRASAHIDRELSEMAANAFLLEPTDKYARYFSRVVYRNTREWKEELVTLKDGPADASPEAFMEQLEGPLAKQFFSTPIQRVHWWVYGKKANGATVQNWMAAFRKGGWRLKPLLKHVFMSQAYKAMPAVPGKRGASGFPARRLDAEVLDDTICELTGLTRSLESTAPEPYTFLPPNRKSVLIEDGSITSSFLILFGKPTRDKGLMSERDNTITAKQRLYLFNSVRVWNGLGAMVKAPEFAKLDHRRQIEDLYYRFLSRPPDQAEYFLFDKREKVDARVIAWHLLNTREFLYRI